MKKIVDYIVNEAKFNAADIKNVLTMASLPSKFHVDIKCSAGSIESDFVVKHSVGPIVEAMIASSLTSFFDGEHNDWKFTHILNNREKNEDETINTACDGYFKNVKTNDTINIEIKAYKTSSNLKPTAKQWDADYIFLVKYDIDDNANITIKDFALGEPNGNINKSVKITKDIIANAHR